MGTQRKPCQWAGTPCTHPAVSGEKYCRPHRVEMIRKMEADGYLEPLPQRTPRRKRTEKEDTDQTKYGTDA